MIYFLKKSTPSSKGLYLQIYINYYDPQTKTKKNKSYKSLGYACDLIEKGIADPISYYQDEVKRLNDELKEKNCAQISDKSLSKYCGHFLLSSLFNLLDMDDTLNKMTSNYKCHYKFSELFKTLCYAQVLSPGSKLKAFERVIPNIYGAGDYSYDQILDAINYIGGDYHKYVELLNKHISKNWERETNNVYFDCTNYYFEIDTENDWLRKGPSKENHKSPILGHALLLDANQIPLDTEFYPGNESEKPYLRKRIENMKNRNNVTGRVIQVADKGLNCARNIYSAVKESNDGYIFSKSIRGKAIDKEFKDWILKDEDKLNQWEIVYDHLGNVKYKYKTAKHINKHGEIVEYCDYRYKCKINQDDEKETQFTVTEKRIVTYNPSLARKQRAEILKEVEKLKNTISYKRALKEELGDSSKYVNFEAKDEEGKKIKIATSINQEKVAEDLMYCGYNMLITSEINTPVEQIYTTYHNLWRIEESFRLLKTYLEARPAFVSKEETIYGHFLICYISLTLIRLLELKIFDDEIPAAQLFEFMRQYMVTEAQDGSFINTSMYSKTYEKIKEKLGLTKLGNLYLTKRDLTNIFENELL